MKVGHIHDGWYGNHYNRHLHTSSKLFNSYILFTFTEKLNGTKKTPHQLTAACKKYRSHFPVVIFVVVVIYAVLLWHAQSNILIVFLLSLLWKQQLSFKCYYGHTIESGRQCAACCCNHIPHELKFQSSWNTNVIIVGHGILFKCSIVTGTVPLRENVGDEAPPCIIVKFW